MSWCCGGLAGRRLRLTGSYHNSGRDRYSAGNAYTLNKDSDHPTLLSADAVVQTGLRASSDTSPNGVVLPTYATVNLSIVQTFRRSIGGGTELRLDAINIGDAVYQIRNGTGVGVGAPQYGMRRTILAGLTQRF